jgi:hypothetical protein
MYRKRYGGEERGRKAIAGEKGTCRATHSVNANNIERVVVT